MLFQYFHNNLQLISNITIIWLHKSFTKVQAEEGETLFLRTK
jgi:hypothetical protein